MCCTVRNKRCRLHFPTVQVCERNQPIHDLELAVMVFTLKVLKPYLYSVLYKTYIAHPVTLVLVPKV